MVKQHYRHLQVWRVCTIITNTSHTWKKKPTVTSTPCCFSVNILTVQRVRRQDWPTSGAALFWQRRFTSSICGPAVKHDSAHQTLFWFWPLPPTPPSSSFMSPWGQEWWTPNKGPSKQCRLWQCRGRGYAEIDRSISVFCVFLSAKNKTSNCAPGTSTEAVETCKTEHRLLKYPL